MGITGGMGLTEGMVQNDAWMHCKAFENASQFHFQGGSLAHYVRAHATSMLGGESGQLHTVKCGVTHPHGVQQAIGLLDQQYARTRAVALESGMRP